MGKGKQSKGSRKEHKGKEVAGKEDCNGRPSAIPSAQDFSITGGVSYKLDKGEDHYFGLQDINSDLNGGSELKADDDNEASPQPQVPTSLDLYKDLLVAARPPVMASPPSMEKFKEEKFGLPRRPTDPYLRREYNSMERPQLYMPSPFLDINKTQSTCSSQVSSTAREIMFGPFQDHEALSTALQVIDVLKTEGAFRVKSIDVDDPHHTGEQSTFTLSYQRFSMPPTVFDTAGESYMGQYYKSPAPRPVTNETEEDQWEDQDRASNIDPTPMFDTTASTEDEELTPKPGTGARATTACKKSRQATFAQAPRMILDWSEGVPAVLEYETMTGGVMKINWRAGVSDFVAESAALMGDMTYQEFKTLSIKHQAMHLREKCGARPDPFRAVSSSEFPQCMLEL